MAADAFASPVAAALRETGQLAGELDADLDEATGGFRWWGGYGLPSPLGLDLADYLMSAIGAMDKHLNLASFLAADFAQAALAENFDMAASVRTVGDPFPGPFPSPKWEWRAARIDAARNGFFASAASVMDAMSAVVIGVAGLHTDIQRADINLLTPFSLGADYPRDAIKRRLKISAIAAAGSPAASAQESLLRALRTSVLEAGPTDWWRWVDDTRNALTHRGARLNMTVQTDRPGKAEQLYVRPLARFPKAPDMVELRRRRRRLDSTYLAEDAHTTMVGVLGSLNLAVVGSLVAARALWSRRRDDPALIAQPAAQWRTDEDDEVPAFPGYAPAPSTSSDQATQCMCIRRWPSACGPGSSPGPRGAEHA